MTQRHGRADRVGGAVQDRDPASVVTMRDKVEGTAGEPRGTGLGLAFLSATLSLVSSFAAAAAPIPLYNRACLAAVDLWHVKTSGCPAMCRTPHFTVSRDRVPGKPSTQAQAHLVARR